MFSRDSVAMLVLSFLIVLAHVFAGRTTGDDFFVIRLVASRSGAAKSGDDFLMLAILPLLVAMHLLWLKLRYRCSSSIVFSLCANASFTTSLRRS